MQGNENNSETQRCVLQQKETKQNSDVFTSKRAPDCLDFHSKLLSFRKVLNPSGVGGNRAKQQLQE